MNGANMNVFDWAEFDKHKEKLAMILHNDDKVGTIVGHHIIDGINYEVTVSRISDKDD